MNKILRKIRLYFGYIKIFSILKRNRNFWKEYYKKHRINNTPSNFAIFCMQNYIQKDKKKDKKLLELGCGNGRDAFFFAKNGDGLNVLAIDIEEEEIIYLNKHNNYKNLQFLAQNFCSFEQNSSFDYIYSRFTLHSISELEQLNTLKNTYKNLKQNGIFFIEARSLKNKLNDDMVRLSNSENFDNHYRRFINFDEILTDLKDIGFEILYSIETNGLAKYKDEDPICINIVAIKK